ncbi:MAG: rod shape-determining protein [Patescibacteria group bacterium]|nr:rod shape-determining protein [Patescibacteria group bacterium]
MQLVKYLQNVSFNKVFGSLSYDIGIDLGTANTLVWIKGKGIVIKEPSAVARHKKTKQIMAIGTAAKRMLGRSPKTIEAIRPLKDGVIADFDATSAMLTHYIKKIHQSHSVVPKIPRPKVVIGIPSGVTEVEKKAVADAAIFAGAREVHLIEEPMAAAIGAELSVDSADGNFVVDIGGGTSEIAVISLGGVVVGRSIRVAGDEMNEAIVNYVRLKYSLLLGESTAEEAKIAIGTCIPFDKERFFVVRGRDLETGLPRTEKLSSEEVREALLPIVSEINRAIISTLEETPPELLSDIMKKGIYLAGGGALLHGIDKIISEATKIKIVIVNDPLTCVVRGCGKVLEDFGLLSKIKLTKGV